MMRLSEKVAISLVGFVLALYLSLYLYVMAAL